jgi:hypothetical protein
VREAENSFEDVARKWWAFGKSLRHGEYVLRGLEAEVFPDFGHKSMDAVTAADFRKLILVI